jgi:hypothetical protein
MCVCVCVCVCVRACVCPKVLADWIIVHDAERLLKGDLLRLPADLIRPTPLKPQTQTHYTQAVLHFFYTFFFLATCSASESTRVEPL